MEEQRMTDICQQAIDTFGIESQKRMLVEECGELLTAIAREYRHRANRQDIITELADVSILVEQIALAYGYADFKAERDFKLTRLKHRIEARQAAIDLKLPPERYNEL